jgi:hypothetical protein
VKQRELARKILEDPLEVPIEAELPRVRVRRVFRVAPRGELPRDGSQRLAIAR